MNRIPIITAVLTTSLLLYLLNDSNNGMVFQEIVDSFFYALSILFVFMLSKSAAEHCRKIGETVAYNIFSNAVTPVTSVLFPLIFFLGLNKTTVTDKSLIDLFYILMLIIIWLDYKNKIYGYLITDNFFRGMTNPETHKYLFVSYPPKKCSDLAIYYAAIVVLWSLYLMKWIQVDIFYIFR